MDTLASLIEGLGLALVRLAEMIVPAAVALEDFAGMVGFFFALVFSLLVLACTAGLKRRK